MSEGLGPGPGPKSGPKFNFQEAKAGMVQLYSEVQCIISNGHVKTPEQNDRQILPSLNFIDGW